MGEHIVNLNNDLDVNRKQMPQIAAADVPEFLRFLKDKGVSFEQVLEKVGNIKPTQRHINADKVKGMVNNFDAEKMYQHFIVSKGNRLLDGHHRWATIKVKDGDADVNVIRVDLPIGKLIELGHDFDLSFTKGIAEVIKIKPIIEAWYHERDKTKHKPGDVWKGGKSGSPLAPKWGAMNTKGSIHYFEQENLAQKFSKGPYKK